MNIRLLISSMLYCNEYKVCRIAKQREMRLAMTPLVGNKSSSLSLSFR